MNKPTQEQLNKIKNAKSKDEAYEEYWTTRGPAYEKYKAIQKPAKKAYDAIKKPAYKEYRAIEEPARKAYLNWTKPKPDYSKMSKEELIKLLEER